MPSLELRTKDSAVHAGHSLLLAQSKVPTQSKLAVSSHSLNNNLLIVPSLEDMETLDVQVVLWTAPSNTLLMLDFKLKLPMDTLLLEENVSPTKQNKLSS